MNPLELAISEATKAHAGQVDKIGEPYILHPLRVMLAVETETLRIAAVLHDVVEDTDYTLYKVEELFGGEVGRIVNALTFRPHEETRDYYYGRILDVPDAVTVKLADIADNYKRLHLIQDRATRERLMIKYEKASQRLTAAKIES